MKQSLGRLFWKLFIALWLSTVLSFALAAGYFLLVGIKPPSPPPGVGRALPWLLGLSLSLCFSAAVAWYLSGPLRHLRWGLRRVADEHFDTRVMPLMGRRRDEIVDLATDFDTMAARLEWLTENRRSLLHDLSHELRSPLARMQAAVGLWRQAPDDGRPLAERVTSEVARLNALVDELLTLHRLEWAESRGGEPLVLQRIDLHDLIEAIATDGAYEAQVSGVHIQRVQIDRFVATVDGDLLYRAIENVVRNALHHSPPGGRVDVSARVADSGGWLHIAVADRGPGVPADKLQAIFEPFVRIEPARASRSTGLGLAVARRAVELHGGRISARLREGGGLVVEIEMPAARD